MCLTREIQCRIYYMFHMMHIKHLKVEYSILALSQPIINENADWF